MKKRKAKHIPAEEYIADGSVCGFCIRPIEQTLNGKMVRHVENKLEYGHCRQALESRVTSITHQGEARE